MSENSSFASRVCGSSVIEEAEAKKFEDASSEMTFYEWDADEVDQIDWGFQKGVGEDKPSSGDFFDYEFPVWQEACAATVAKHFATTPTSIIWRRMTHIKHIENCTPPEEAELPEPLMKAEGNSQAQYDEHIAPRAETYTNSVMVWQIGKVVEKMVNTPALKAPQAPEGSLCVNEAEAFRMPACIVNENRTTDFSNQVETAMSIIDDSRTLVPNGLFLWELISPKTKVSFQREEPVNQDGDSDPQEAPEPQCMLLPVLNPSGKYIVRLFIMGKWRRILVDDLIPCTYNGQSCKTLFPQACTNSILCKILPQLAKKNKQRKLPANLDVERFASVWPLLICKAIMKVYYRYHSANSFPIFHMLTGYNSVVKPLTWGFLTQHLLKVRSR